MLVYICNFLSVPIYGKLIKSKKLLVAIISLQTFLILALRHELLGVDLVGYREYYYGYQAFSFGDIFNGFSLIENKLGFEFGYVLLNKIVGSLGFDFHGFLVVYAAICILCVSRFIYRYSDDVPMSFMIFFSLGAFVTMFGILRQSLGLAILLFAIPSIKKKHFIRFLLLILLASLFHKTLLLAFPLYFLDRIRVKRSTYFKMIICSFLIISVTPILSNLLVKVMAMFGKNYSSTGFEWNNMYLVILFLTVFVALFYDFENDQNDNVFHWGFIFALLIQSLTFYYPVFSRISNAIFMNFTCIVLAKAFQMKQKDLTFRGPLRFAMICGLLVLFVYSLKGSQEMVPYTAFWQEVSIKI